MEKSRIYTGPILILGTVQLIESIAFALPMSFFPNYVVSLGASVASVGLFTSSFMIASAFLSPKMGSLTDKYGRKRLLTFGIGSDVILGILTGLVPSWEWLLLIRLFNGAVSSAAMLAGETLLIDTVDPARRGGGRWVHHVDGRYRSKHRAPPRWDDTMVQPEPRRN